MAEPLEWIAIGEIVGEGVILAGESLGIIGTAAETAAVTTTVAEVATGSTLVAETVGGGAAPDVSRYDLLTIIDLKCKVVMCGVLCGQCCC